MGGGVITFIRGTGPFRAQPSRAEWIDGSLGSQGQQTARTFGPFGAVVGPGEGWGVRTGPVSVD